MFYQSMSKERGNGKAKITVCTDSTDFCLIFEQQEYKPRLLRNFSFFLKKGTTKHKDNFIHVHIFTITNICI